MKMIDTIEGVIGAFGGPTKMAEWSGSTISTFSNWIERKHIPPSWHLRLMIEARRRGLQIAPEVFGLEDADAQFLRNHKLVDVSDVAVA
jgi:hypothetical protein